MTIDDCGGMYARAASGLLGNGSVAREVREKAEEYLSRAGLTKSQVARLDELGYFSCPASRRNHLAVPGGLVVHSMHVTDQLLSLHVFDTAMSAYKVGMLHDLVKCLNYVWDDDRHEYAKKSAPYPGHGVASVMLADYLGIALTEEEKQAVIWHMGAFAVRDRDLDAAYDAATLLFPRQIVLTHAADHLAASLEKRYGNNGK